MSFLQNDYENIKETGYEPLPTGVYECVINKASERATKNGAESLQLDLVVRNDLDSVPTLSETNAKYHNRHVFMDNWKRKATKQFDVDGLMTIARSAGEPNGKEYPVSLIFS